MFFPDYNLVAPLIGTDAVIVETNIAKGGMYIVKFTMTFCSVQGWEEEEIFENEEGLVIFDGGTFSRGPLWLLSPELEDASPQENAVASRTVSS